MSRVNFGAKPVMYPMPVLIIATYDENGVPDAMNAAWGIITDMNEISISMSEHKTTENLAMTGEITLRGKVLPVGGIKEKILAAKRAGIKEIILCEENRKNIEEIQDIYLKGLTFHYVKDIKEVFALALTEEKVADAIDFSK